MSRLLQSIISIYALTTSVYSAPASISTSSSSLTAVASSSSNIIPAWSTDSPTRTASNAQAPTSNPQPMMDGLGASDIGPQNEALEQLNIDSFAPPTTDQGTL